MPQNVIAKSAKDLATAVAEHFVALAREAIATRGRFSVVLAGGSTPRGVYERLASKGFAERVDWQRIHLFWGDERCVPPDHADSNTRMARETLIDRVPIPSDQVHRICGENPPLEAALAYEKLLHTHFSASTRTFDLVLLGMGEDGHCASLFPGTAAIHEEKHWVVAHYVDKLQAWRITLTPVMLNAAAEVAFIVSGEEKAERVRQVQNDIHRPRTLPAQIIRPASDRLTWFLDQPAASLLEK